jgi:hypothetical protein
MDPERTYFSTAFPDEVKLTSVANGFGGIVL